MLQPFAVFLVLFATLSFSLPEPMPPLRSHPRPATHPTAAELMTNHWWDCARCALGCGALLVVCSVECATVELNPYLCPLCLTAAGASKACATCIRICHPQKEFWNALPQVKGGHGGQGYELGRETDEDE